MQYFKSNTKPTNKTHIHDEKGKGTSYTYAICGYYWWGKGGLEFTDYPTSALCVNCEKKVTSADLVPTTFVVVPDGGDPVVVSAKNPKEALTFIDMKVKEASVYFLEGIYTTNAWVKK
jgi:hypothetical protein